KADVNTEGPYKSLSIPLSWNVSSLGTCTPQACSLSTENATNQKPSGPKHCSPFRCKSAFQMPKSPTHPKSSHLRSSSINSDVVFFGSTNDGKEKSKAKPKVLRTWPDSAVLLSQVLKWHYNIFTTKNIRQAWDSCFGKAYQYGQSTAYQVDVWIFIVGAVTLSEVVKATPQITLREARKTYTEEWKQARESKNKYCGANEGQKQKQCGDSGSAVSRKKMQHNGTLANSSDIEVVSY
ncbi:hypothetical protein DFH28DRAFT_161880, partial [Melampsora americana]